jgi:hypothetical protein
MAAGGHPTPLDRVFHRVGYAVEEVLDAARRTAGRAVERAQDLAAGGADRLPDWRMPDADGALEELLRPGTVRWPRAVLAGIIGTLVFDAVARLEPGRVDRKFGTSEDGDPDGASLAGRYLGGAALAALYARYLHDRLDAPPLVQGLAFGMASLATEGRGGLLPLLGAATGLPLPRELQGPAGKGRSTPGVVAAHLAFGVAVGVVYGRVRR